MREPHTKPWAHHGGCQRWWRIRESTKDEDVDASRQSSRTIDAEDEVKATVATRAPGLSDPRTRRGRRHAPMLPIPDVQCKGHNETCHCLWKQ